MWCFVSVYAAGGRRQHKLQRTLPFWPIWIALEYAQLNTHKHTPLGDLICYCLGLWSQYIYKYLYRGRAYERARAQRKRTYSVACCRWECFYALHIGIKHKCNEAVCRLEKTRCAIAFWLYIFSSLLHFCRRRCLLCHACACTVRATTFIFIRTVMSNLIFQFLRNWRFFDWYVILILPLIIKCCR